MKLFDRWLAHSFDWQSLGLALLIVVVSFLLIRGVVRGIFHFIEISLSILDSQALILRILRYEL